MNKRQWALAILVAAIGSPFKVRQGFQAIRIWLNYRNEPKAAPEVASARLRACEACPVYYAPLKTCGSFLNKELRPLGCKCYAPALCALEYGHCWADANGLGGPGIGWENGQGPRVDGAK